MLKCFLAMAFDHKDTDLLYDHIAKTLRAMGIHPIRVDRVEHNDDIDDRIFKEIPGLDRYFGQSATSLIPVAMWVLAAILLSVPWAIAWTSNRFHCLWRVPLALMVTIVPPLGIIGLASPVTAAGYLFPGTAWVGLAAVALLPGIVLSVHAFALRRRCVVLCLVSASAVGLAIGGRLLTRGDAAPPPGWTAVNTHFGDIQQPFRDFLVAQFVQQKAAETSARVLIFPESVVPRWSEATEAFWRQSLDRCGTRGQILAIGAGLPVKTGTPKDNREELSDLRSFDFGAAIDVLKRIDPQSPPAMQRSVCRRRSENRPVNAA